MPFRRLKAQASAVLTHSEATLSRTDLALDEAQKQVLRVCAMAATALTEAIEIFDRIQAGKARANLVIGTKVMPVGVQLTGLEDDEPMQNGGDKPKATA